MRDYPHLTYWEVVHSLVHLFWLSICLSYQQRVDIAIQNSIDSYFQNMQTFCLNSTQKTHNRWNYTQEVSPIFIWKNNWTKKEVIAMSGNRTRVNCLEGSYANHYTNIAWWEQIQFFRILTFIV